MVAATPQKFIDERIPDELSESSESMVLDDLSVNDFYEEADPVRNIIIDSMYNKNESKDVKAAQWHAKVYGYSPDLNKNLFLKKRNSKIKLKLDKLKE